MSSLRMLIDALPQLAADGIIDKSDPAVLRHKSALHAYVYFVTSLYGKAMKAASNQSGGMEGEHR